MTYLFLDDTRMPIDVFRYSGDPDYAEFKWVIVRNYAEFTYYIQEYFSATGEMIFFVSYDHDLGVEHTAYFFDNGGHASPPDPSKATFTEKTGFDCAKWLVDFCIDNNVELPKYKVHSKNPVGKINIESYLGNYLKHSAK